jgi:hypothetical protein
MDGTSALTLCNQGTERGTIGSSLKESCPLIEVAGLGKTHGDQVALTDISFVAGQGKLIGIIGDQLAWARQLCSKHSPDFFPPNQAQSVLHMITSLV